MKIEQLPSGNWHCRKTINGTTYSLTFEKKPNKNEIAKAVTELLEHQNCVHDMTFEQASKQYMEIKKNVLSPTTIKNYGSILRNTSASFKKMKIDKISSVDIQREINNYASTHSPKSVRNLSGFITAVMSMYAPDIKIHTKLPQKQHRENYVPTHEEIATILEEAKGTEYQYAFELATYGLRRSESLAIDPSTDIVKDENGYLLSINKALVVGVDKSLELKHYTKSEAGTRSFYIDDELAEALIERGYVYKGYPNNVLRQLKRIQKKYGMPSFRLHDFRVYYASSSHAANVPDAYTMYSGGWRSQATLTNVYRRAMSEEIVSTQLQTIERLKKLKEKV